MATLCSKCGKNEATIHVCEVVNGVTTSTDLCETCAPAPYRSLKDEVLHLQMVRPEDRSRIDKEYIISRIQSEFPPLTRDEAEVLAYVSACVGTAIGKASKETGKRPLHVRAHEILAVAAEVAKDKFGPGAQEKLKTLGITSSAAFGEFIYKFIGAGILGKLPADRIEDFQVRSALDEFLDEA